MFLAGLLLLALGGGSIDDTVSVIGAAMGAIGVFVLSQPLGRRVRDRVTPPAGSLVPGYRLDVTLGKQWLRPRIIRQALHVIRSP
jgi:hypothetical protein